jgi:Flp pilus assembly protein TadG
MCLKTEEGQAMVEFALILPILLLVICGILEFGWIFGNQLLADNAVREAARYTAIHYYDSSTDNDQAIAAAIVIDRAPTLAAPTVTLSLSGSSVSVNVSCRLSLLTPIISALFSDGKYPITSLCTMRLE